MTSDLTDLQGVISELEKKLPQEAEVLRRADFPNKRLLIIGATGGIGRTAAKLAQTLGIQGANLVITYNSERSKTKAKEIAASTKAAVLQYSHGTYEAAKSLVERLQGSVDYLLDASGITGQATITGLRRDLERDPQLLERMFSANALGPFYLYLELIGGQKLSSGAQLAYLSTIAVDGHQNQAHYAASKAAMASSVASWMLDQSVVERGIGLKSLELAVVNTGNHEAKTFARRIAAVERSKPGIAKELEAKGYFMSPCEAAYRCLAAVADPAKTGRVRIPEGASVDSVLRVLSGAEGVQRLS